MKLEPFNLEEYKKITDPEKLKQSMFIQASAGTGKTYTITGIIKKLVKSNFDLEKILVVTYTEKAAGELRDRIRAACPDKDVDNAPIFTIHSFCQKTLSEFSFTANQCANLSLVEDGAVEDFIDLWIRDVLKEDEDFKKLFETADNQNTFIDNLKREFKEAISKYYLNTQGDADKSIVTLDETNFLEYNDNPLTFEEFDKITNPNSIEDLFILKDFETSWNVLKANSQAKKVQAFMDDILTNITINHTYTFNGHQFQNRSFDIQEVKDAFDIFKNIKDVDYKKLAGKKSKLPQIKFYNSQIKKLYLAWQQEKEKNKMQSYDDMLRNVREAVCNKGSELKNQLQKKYDFAIIDEFQDTNQKQWDIFSTVFMEDNQHTIIVVGDPKQSIYSFQGADVNVYNNAVEAIAEKGGLAKSLSTNFRSTDPMVEGCNFLFQNFFDSKSGINFINSNPSGTKATATFKNPKTGEYEEMKPIWIAGNAQKSVTEQAFAKLAVQTIVDCCTWENGKTKLQVFDEDKKDAQGRCLEHRNVTFRDFAILVRASSEFTEIEQALKEAGIPFIRYKDANLFYGSECIQWISLFKAITAKDFTGYNRTILSEALFTDFFGIQLEDVEDELFDNPSCKERQMLIQWQQLAQLRKWANLLEKIFKDTNIENKLSQLDKMQELTKIRQIGNYVVDYLYKTESSLDDVCKHLLRLSNAADSSLDEGNIVEKGTDFDSVQLMTIHASKGLEFPVVIAPAGLRARNPFTAKTWLYHDKQRNAKLSFSPYGEGQSRIEDDYERTRIYYVAYTRASSLLVLPLYDVWNPEISEEKAEMHNFLKTNITALFDAKNKKGKSFVRELKEIKIEDLNKSVQLILQENQKIREKQKTKTEDLTEEEQRSAAKTLSKKVPELVLRKHSYVSLSHKQNTTEDITVNNAAGRINKEGESYQNNSLAEFDTAPNPVTFTAIPASSVSCLPAVPAPEHYPKGTKLGIALHEVFEKADFAVTADDENLRRLITACFEKQTLRIPEDDPHQWLTYTSALLCNTLSAKLPEIKGSTQTGKYFSLKELKAEDRISEAEFNMNADDSAALLKNYCNGFIDLVFKRNVNGRDIYSILDWKSDTFNANQYSDGEFLKKHTDAHYSIQRVLYSYSLIKWLAIFYKNEYETDTEVKVFENHFGGIYYVYVRGCHADTCSGIYARTWSSWKELENAFYKIMGAEHESNR